MLASQVLVLMTDPPLGLSGGRGPSRATYGEPCPTIAMNGLLSVMPPSRPASATAFWISGILAISSAFIVARGEAGALHHAVGIEGAEGQQARAHLVRHFVDGELCFGGGFADVDGVA